MIVLKTVCLILISLVIGSEVDKDDYQWIHKHVPTPIEYTLNDEVAIVYNTDVDKNSFLVLMMKNVNNETTKDISLEKIIYYR